MHKTDARLARLRYQAVCALTINGMFIVDLHAKRLIKAVLDIGNDTAQLLQRLALFTRHQILFNAVPQAYQRLVKLNLRAVGTAAHIVEPVRKQRRTALYHIDIRVIVAEAIEVCGVEHIQHALS